jgi:hypothetical protein
MANSTEAGKHSLLLVPSKRHLAMRVEKQGRGIPIQIHHEWRVAISIEDLVADPSERDVDSAQSAIVRSHTYYRSVKLGDGQDNIAA